MFPDKGQTLALAGEVGTARNAVRHTASVFVQD